MTYSYRFTCRIWTQCGNVTLKSEPIAFPVAMDSVKAQEEDDRQQNRYTFYNLEYCLETYSGKRSGWGKAETVFLSSSCVKTEKEIQAELIAEYNKRVSGYSWPMRLGQYVGLRGKVKQTFKTVTSYTRKRNRESARIKAGKTVKVKPL